MCHSYTIYYTNCGHVKYHPWLCEPAKSERPIRPCHGWRSAMRENFQAEDGDCPECRDSNSRLARTLWRSGDNESTHDHVPVRSRRGSLPQRYVPTPPPANASGYNYGSGYGYGYGEGEQRGPNGDPDPSQQEVQRRVSRWARDVPPFDPASHASTERDLVYRPHGRASTHNTASSSRHAHSAAQSHVPRHHRRHTDIYDPRPHRNGHSSRADIDSGRDSYYIRGLDEERHRRPGYPSSLPPVAGSSTTRRYNDRRYNDSRYNDHGYDDFAMSVTTTYQDVDGLTVIETRTSEYQTTRSEDINNTDAQNQEVGASYPRHVRRGRGIQGGDESIAFLRGPQPPQPPNPPRRL